MFHVFDNVLYLFDCQHLCITMCCMFFYIFHSFCCYNMKLYFGPAALHYIINNILSYLILSYTYMRYKLYILYCYVLSHEQVSSFHIVVYST